MELYIIVAHFILNHRVVSPFRTFTERDSFGCDLVWHMSSSRMFDRKFLNRLNLPPYHPLWEAGLDLRQLRTYNECYESVIRAINRWGRRNCVDMGFGFEENIENVVRLIVIILVTSWGVGNGKYFGCSPLASCIKEAIHQSLLVVYFEIMWDILESWN